MKPDKYQLAAIKSNTNTLLIAGAGAGKTFTIIEKVKYLITQNIVKPQEILIISYTNKSTEDLKKRLTYDIQVLTFHKLAMKILDSYQVPYNIKGDSYLEYVINEFFLSLTNNTYIKEILKYFKEYDYKIFLNTYKYKEFKNILVKLIKLYKTNNCTKDNFKALFKINDFLAKYTYIVYCIYTSELASDNSLDLDDLIIKATLVLNKSTNYKYIIIDEFQDTSLIRFNLIKKIYELSKSTLFCVGDDYQSIYHFSGCDLNIFLNFSKTIPNTSVMKLKNTYRNSQELINISTKFIMKNNLQNPKDLISLKHEEKPIEYIYYINPKKAFQKIYQKLKNNNTSLLVLGRNNFDIKIFSNKEIPEFMTVHAAKGLESDNVILINLTNNLYGFPNKIINTKILEELHPTDKSILYAEERRLFYVALTRTKNKVYILVPLINKSCFIKEIKKLK